MYIHDVMHETVGFLCTDVHTEHGVFAKWPIGTCFFVSVFDDETKRTGTSYLVTAKHVWRDYFRGGKPAYVRLNTDSPNEPAVYVELSHDWRFHPDEAVDLAVLPMRGLGDTRGAMHNTMDMADIMGNSSYLRGLQCRWPPAAGEAVVYLGMMIEYSGYRRNRPVARFGHVALATDEHIEGPFGLAHYYLAELQTYPGHSGGPVWVRYETLGQELILLGVMAAGYPGQQQVSWKTETGETVEAIVNLGISLITPIDKLEGILMTPEMDAERKRNIVPPTSAKPIATSAKPPEDFTKDDFLDALKRVSRKQSDEEKSGT